MAVVGSFTLQISLPKSFSLVFAQTAKPVDKNDEPSTYNVRKIYTNNQGVRRQTPSLFYGTFRMDLYVKDMICLIFDWLDEV